MLRKCLMIAFVLVGFISCTTVKTAISNLPITLKAKREPLSTETSTVIANNPKSSITIVGVVMDVSFSARLIFLKNSIEGFSVLALTENCELISSNGEKIELRNIQPGMSIQASGQPGESDALLTDSILVLETTSMTNQMW